MNIFTYVVGAVVPLYFLFPVTEREVLLMAQDIGPPTVRVSSNEPDLGTYWTAP